MAHVVLPWLKVIASFHAQDSCIAFSFFRPSGTEQFSPTGKYKADGVLETVRLSGKLSRKLWLCLGTVSFHISKSFLTWGWARPPEAPALHLGLGRAEVGAFGDGLWSELALWPRG